MPLKIESHVLDASEENCARCGLQIPRILFDAKGLVAGPGDRVGVITGLKYTPPSAYLIRNHEHDSNRLCAPLSRIAYLASPISP